MEKARKFNGFGCVILAAGLGTRFGGGKLLAEFGGVPLYARTMDTVPGELHARTVVVSRDEHILRAAEERGFRPIVNDRPEEGISRSVRLGLEALEDCGGVLFMVADQPLLEQATVERILRAGRDNPGRIIAPVRADGRPGNPCLFPAAFFGELLRLQGDKGGRSVIAAHPEALVTIPADSRELTDVDSRRALEELEHTI